MCCSFEYSLLAAVVNGSSVGKVIAVEAKTDQNQNSKARERLSPFRVRPQIFSQDWCVASLHLTVQQA